MAAWPARDMDPRHPEHGSERYRDGPTARRTEAPDRRRTSRIPVSAGKDDARRGRRRASHPLHPLPCARSDNPTFIRPRPRGSQDDSCETASHL